MAKTAVEMAEVSTAIERGKKETACAPVAMIEVVKEMVKNLPQ